MKWVKKTFNLFYHVNNKVFKISFGSSLQDFRLFKDNFFITKKPQNQMVSICIYTGLQKAKRWSPSFASNTE